MRRPTLALLLGLAPFGAWAADADTQSLIDELRKLSDQAREQRAADRWLQRALDALVARYDWPWQRELINDDFADGNYDQDPSWQVVRGQFRVARGRGLRSRAEPAGAAPAGDPGQPPSVEAAVIGALLQHALGGGDQGQARAPLQSDGEPQQIRLDAAITNAFAIEAGFSLESPRAPGDFALAVLQGANGRYGYRLRLHSGASGFVELERVRGGRGAVVERAPLPFDIADGGPHRLGWRQAANGDVTVELDGQGLFAVRDKAFRDNYQQLLLSHAAGDLTLHNLRVSGTD